MNAIEMNSVVSDEALHAFVDGELDVAESEVLIARMRDDKALAQRVCALRSLQSMVRLAYAEPPAPDGRAVRSATNRQFMQRFAVGCLVLLAGLSGGWALRGAGSANAVTFLSAMPSGFQTVSLARQADPNRVLLHIDSAAPDKMLAVLDQAERLLDEAERQGRTMQLEVIANSHGLKLLRAGVSPYADRMAQMKQRHANLKWVACGQSIARLQKDGEKVMLLPNTQTSPTAISEIVTRLQQGWTYVRV
jgi:intracellular sulfur oxidation DsrE/DsrF family protein